MYNLKGYFISKNYDSKNDGGLSLDKKYFNKCEFVEPQIRIHKILNSQKSCS